MHHAPCTMLNGRPRPWLRGGHSPLSTVHALSKAVFALVVAVLLMLVGCDGQPMSNHVIAQNDDYYVTGDSVVDGDIIVTAVTPQRLDGNLNLNSAEQLLQRAADTDTVPYCLTTGHDAQFPPSEQYPLYQSQQTLIDALYNLSVNDINANHSRSGGFNSHQDHSSLYAAIYLSLAILDPDRAMMTLRGQVEDGLVMQKEGTWPVCDDRMGWPIAAWEVYCATGDLKWLNEAYDVTLNTIDEQLIVQYDRHDGLMHGGQLGRYAAGNFYPDWATALTLTEAKTLINNVLTVRALEIANDMAEELGEPSPYPTEAQHLREAVNQAMWDESRGRYCAYLLGQIAPMQSPLTDNMAQALAVLWNLADDDRSTTLVEKTPICSRGILPTYPAASIEPHLENPSWTLTQACWNMAAATVGNEHALRLGLAALYRAQALYQPQHLVIEGRPANSLASAASNAAMILRVLAGMEFTPEGIEFAPTVPACLPGNKTLLNLFYRNATLDITIVGTGNDIEQMTLDGQTVEGNYIPCDIKGHHNVFIKLKQGKSRSDHVTLATNLRLPPTPDVQWMGDSAHISPWLAPPLAYKLVINGVRSYNLSDSIFKLPSTLPKLAQVNVVSANRYSYSVPSRMMVVVGQPPADVVLSDSTLQADTLVTRVRIDRAGTYLVSADYSIMGGCDIILIEANGHSQGVLYLPAIGIAGPLRSNLAAVQLLRGDNVLTLRRYRIGYRATLDRLLLYHLP